MPARQPQRVAARAPERQPQLRALPLFLRLELQGQRWRLEQFLLVVQLLAMARKQEGGAKRAGGQRGEGQKEVAEGGTEEKKKGFLSSIVEFAQLWPSVVRMEEVACQVKKGMQATGREQYQPLRQTEVVEKKVPTRRKVGRMERMASDRREKVEAVARKAREERQQRQRGVRGCNWRRLLQRKEELFGQKGEGEKVFVPHEQQVMMKAMRARLLQKVVVEKWRKGMKVKSVRFVEEGTKKQKV